MFAASPFLSRLRFSLFFTPPFLHFPLISSRRHYLVAMPD